jgi:hypothetical protein
MKSLNIEETYRLWLDKRKALGFDHDHNEILAGLTHEESVFYVDVAANMMLRVQDLPEAELAQFVDLYNRHISAVILIHAS